MNTSTHHNIHHSDVRWNYGKCCNGWDTLMGTNHPAYAERFDLVKARVAGRDVAPAARAPAGAPSPAARAVAGAPLATAAAALPGDAAGS